MQNHIPLKIEELLVKVNENQTGKFNRDPQLIAILPQKIACIIGDDKIYISEFVIAKIKGMVMGVSGHPKITDEVFKKVPESLSNPYRIFRDIRRLDKKEYLFINMEPLHQIIVEIERKFNNLSEINTIFETSLSELKRLEGKLPTVYSSGETPISRIRASKE